MMEYQHGLKIPKNRIAVLIGTKGVVKRKLEQSTNTNIFVDSDEGDVLVKGEDTIKVYQAQEIVKAIGRGFNPDTAMLLLKQDYGFDILNIKDYISNPKQIKRLKGRVIGSKGKSRRTLEELTKTYISVYGKTIGIIGEVSNVAFARRAVEMLLEGSMHATVFKMLEKARRSIRFKKIGGKNI
ncbi:MAG: hypothetical protein MAG795_01208 [Candidatus Woesearchaeota archaeon]|nr:hypothetical protein [Candidatus Woesearchaeota archaeon]